MLHLTAIVYTLVIFLFLAAAYSGWGLALARLLGIHGKTPGNAVMPIWLGWVFTLFIFQVLHFFFPITAYVVLPILIPGAMFSIPGIIKGIKRVPGYPLARPGTWAAVILFFGVSAWIASRAMLPPSNFDSGLYHFNSIRWINEYPIVPGLGNLHGRLAFNESFFTYVAALNVYPFFGHGRSLANSFLLLLLLATVLLYLLPALSRPALLTGKHPYHYLPSLFVLPVAIYIGLTSDLASPLPDVASTLLQLTLFVVLAHGMAQWADGRKEQEYGIVFLMITAAAAVTVKLSNAAFSATIMGLSLVFLWQTQTSRPRIRDLARIILPPAVLIVVYGIRGFILSGAPFYPSTIGYVPFDWAVPRKDVVNMANWIYSWARHPNTAWSNVLGRWDWFRPWLSGLNNWTDIIHVLYPVAVSVVFGGIAVSITVFPFFKKVPRLRFPEWAILLPSLLGFIFWFVTAPSPRFANGVFWLLAIGASLILLTSLHQVLSKRLFFPVMVMVLMVANILIAADLLKNRDKITNIPFCGWHPVKKVPLIRNEIFPGLTVYTPADSKQCWDSPLPSTFKVNPYLRLRTPGNIASGFRLCNEIKARPAGKK